MELNVGEMRVRTFVSEMEQNRIGVLGGIPQFRTNSTPCKFKLIWRKGLVGSNLFIGLISSNVLLYCIVNWIPSLMQNLFCRHGTRNAETATVPSR